MREINPEETTRAEAFRLWMDAPMPMVTLIKTVYVTRLVRFSRRKGLKLNMLMCWCVGRAASGIKEFYMLPVGRKLMQYDSIAVNTIVADNRGEVSSCDIPWSEDLAAFNRDYLRLTAEVAEKCMNHDITDSMVIGTSALARYDIDGAVGMYSGIFNDPFLIRGRYRRHFFRRTLTVSFQFHHTQMDGAHAAMFLDRLQKAVLL
ncbi:MAG TPA: chloramphenicol acetyltransferase [Candidatus Coprenecus merdipullorum]|nr:chloramphenicol acetyltransferase [Candidatus Coprenecus merdipullorum]